MKIVKYIFLLLLLATIAVTVFIATQEGKYNIKKDKVINVSRPILYDYINDYKNWENLNILDNADTTATYNFSENTAGKGAFMSWAKNSTTGKIQTTNAVANDSISQKAIVNDLNSALLWRFKDSGSSTNVSITFKGELTFTEKAYALFKGGIDHKVDASLQKGLDNLNTFLVKELKIYKAEVKGIVGKKGAFYLGSTFTSKREDANKNALPAFEKLLAFAKDNKIDVAGMPFIIYKNISKAEGTATYTYALPITDEMFTAPGSDIEGGKLLPFNALKTTLTGDYSHLPNAWAAANKYITEKTLQENTTGQYIEIYTKTGAQTRRPSGYVTDIYIPIGAPQEIIPAEGVIMPPVEAVPATGTGAKPATPSGTKPATTGTKPVTGSVSNTTGSTKPATGTGTTTSPAGTSTLKPTTTAPVKNTGTTTTSRPAATTTARPAGTNTSRPASTTPARATTTTGSGTSTSRPTTGSTTTKPATTGTTRPATSTTTRPATTPTTTRGSATTTTRKTTTSSSRGGVDTLNPPRAER